MSHQKGKTPVIIGFVLFIISFVTLFCNEQNYVNSIKKANFAEQNAIELKSNYISPANDGKLVQLANSVYSNQILADFNNPKSDCSYQNNRNVPMGRVHNQQ